MRPKRELVVSAKGIQIPTPGALTLHVMRNIGNVEHKSRYRDLVLSMSRVPTSIVNPFRRAGRLVIIE